MADAAAAQAEVLLRSGGRGGDPSSRPDRRQEVHPYINRRLGREAVTYPHPSARTDFETHPPGAVVSGAIIAIGYVSGGIYRREAEELRRAMGFKRSTERMHEIEQKLRRGLASNDIHGEAREQIVRSITSFALYGFPESHAASFALLAYARCYLKAHFRRSSTQQC